MLSVRVTLVAILAVAAAACGGYSSAPSPVPSPTTSGGPSSSVVIPSGAETLGNRAYNPDDINVSPGDTVTWKNTDSTAHTSTSDGNGWNSSVIAPGGQFSFTFGTAGTFTYHCTIHPGMVGTVVVR